MKQNQIPMKESYKEKIRQEYYEDKASQSYKNQETSYSKKKEPYKEKIRREYYEVGKANQSYKNQQMPYSKEEKAKNESYKDKVRREYFEIGKAGKQDYQLTLLPKYEHANQQLRHQVYHELPPVKPRIRKHISSSQSMPNFKKAKNSQESYKEKIRREYYGGGRFGNQAYQQPQGANYELANQQVQGQVPEWKTLPGSLSSLFIYERLPPTKTQMPEQVSSDQSKNTKIKQQMCKPNKEQGKKKSYKEKIRREYYGVDIDEKNNKPTRNVCECDEEGKDKKEQDKKESYKEKIRREYYGVGMTEKNDKSTRNIREYEQKEKSQKERDKKESYKEKIRREYYGVGIDEKRDKSARNVSEYEQAYQQPHGPKYEYVHQQVRILPETTIMPNSLSTVTSFQGGPGTKIERSQSPIMISEQVQVPEVFHESLPVQPRVPVKSKKDRLEKEKEREAKRTKKTPKVEVAEKKRDQLSRTTPLRDSMSTIVVTKKSGCFGKRKKQDIHEIPETSGYGR